MLWLEDGVKDVTVWVVADASTPHRRLVSFTPYAGWYHHLSDSGPGRVDDRSVRVDVVCRTVGWLGEYRRSTETGIWFRGQHRWHMLGNRVD